MIYVASPYSSPIAGAQQLRFEKVRGFTAHLLSQGILAFSPIVYAHDLASHFGMRGDAQFWLQFNVDILRRADELCVYCLPGWDKSKGVEIERKIAKGVLIPTTYWNEDYTPNLELTASNGQ